jgi:hypothetical protein
MGSVKDFMVNHDVMRRFPRTTPSPVRLPAFGAISLLPLVARHVNFISRILPISTSSGSTPLVYHSIFLLPVNLAKEHVQQIGKSTLFLEQMELNLHRFSF